MKAKLQEVHTLKTIFWYVMLGIFLLAFSYVYFVNKTVYNVAERERIQSEISKLNTKIGELEFKSISIKNAISPEYAYAAGFIEVKNQEFISRTKAGGLSMRAGSGANAAQ